MKKELNSKNYMVIAGLAIIVVLVAMCFMCCNKGKVATINAQMVVARSAAIRDLQHEQQLQYEEFQKWLQDSDKEIKKQTTAAKKKELMAKLQAELQQRQIVMQQEYAAKTQKIEEEIIAVVEKVAHKKGFKVVMDKSSVIAGGVDITEDVISKIEENEANTTTDSAEEPAEEVKAEENNEAAEEPKGNEASEPAAEPEEKAAE